MTTTAPARTASPTGTTPTRALLEFLAAHPERPVIFELDGETLVQPGYHVTEVKSVLVEAMDCGGQADTWRETIVQLWNPGDELERGFMTARKFRAIYDRVAASVPVRADAEVRFEYGDATRAAAHYHVAALRTGDDGLTVELRAPTVTCKARDRRLASGGSACCAPTAPSAITPDTGAGGCCAG